MKGKEKEHRRGVEANAVRSSNSFSSLTLKVKLKQPHFKGINRSIYITHSQPD